MSAPVAPRAGAWIETHYGLFAPPHLAWSHPVRVRGLKPPGRIRHRRRVHVAPRAGAWIETLQSPLSSMIVPVAPRAGAWIETQKEIQKVIDRASHPVRVRGLKLGGGSTVPGRHTVAPRAGAWIETRGSRRIRLGRSSRTPCGCVD